MEIRKMNNGTHVIVFDVPFLGGKLVWVPSDDFSKKYMGMKPEFLDNLDKV